MNENRKILLLGEVKPEKSQILPSSTSCQRKIDTKPWSNRGANATKIIFHLIHTVQCMTTTLFHRK